MRTRTAAATSFRGAATTPPGARVDQAPGRGVRTPGRPVGDALTHARLGLVAAGFGLLSATTRAEPRSASVVTPVTVRASADAGAPAVGALSRHAPVTVTACVPSCEALRAWAVLGGDGVVPLAVLAWDDGGAPPFVPDTFVWAVARDRDAGVEVRARPRRDAPLLTVEPGIKTLAFRRGDEAAPTAAWLERPGGGFVARGDVVQLDDRSTMRGVEAPTLPLAFTFRQAALASPGTTDGGGAIARFARFPLLALTADGGAHVDGGVLPAKAVRIAWPRERPPGVPDGGRWVHVDLAEQTLTAWDDARPVYATLVSTGTGARGRRTRPGLHQTWVKALHDQMRGDEYFIEEVRFIQYFARGQGLHAASWHDAFGQAVTHGCVNLSTADAQWLFDWAPPRLPDGWHTRWPLAKGEASLWVFVERSSRHLADGGLRAVGVP